MIWYPAEQMTFHIYQWREATTGHDGYWYSTPAYLDGFTHRLYPKDLGIEDI